MEPDTHQKKLQALYLAVREEDEDLAVLVAEQKGLEAFCAHLENNKEHLSTRDAVYGWINAAILSSNLSGSAHEGITLLHRVYEAMLHRVAADAAIPVGSGDILWNLGKLYLTVGYQRASERYYTLALCSDIIGDNSHAHIKTLGAYPALRIIHRHSEGKLDRWVENAIALQREIKGKADPDAWLPENLLTRMKSSLVYEPPSLSEGRAYPVNRFYLKRLLERAEKHENLAANQIGANLELLGNYLFQCVPGCTTQKKPSTTGVPDILVRTIDPPAGFRSTLGECFLCECKNESSPTDVQSASQILDALMETGCAFGVLLALNGTTQNADNRIRIAHIRGVTTILTLVREDILNLIDGEQLIGMLQEKYVKLRFHHTGE
jgi:hypothetical protein